MPDDIKPGDLKTANRITDISVLEEMYGAPSKRAAMKTMPRLNDDCRAYIAASPFLVMGTRGDVSPKGDPPGFVKVLDDNTLIIPDRKGNNRLDGYRNILEDPEVGLIFFVPGVSETLRVNGTAEITDDADLLAQFEERGTVPKTALIINVKEAFIHCAKALIRSRLWDPDAQVDRGTLPTAGAMMAKMTGNDADAEEASYQESVKTGLY